MEQMMPLDRSSAATGTEAADRHASWIMAVAIYLAVSLPAHLAWETLQLPLYTISAEGSFTAQAFAVLHCTVGDVLIASGAIAVGLLLGRGRHWPHERHIPVSGITVAAGIAYTVFSEWWNVEVRGAWAYSELMPLVPPLGTGLSPLLQWLFIPLLALHLARRAALSKRCADVDGAERNPGYP